MDDARVSVTRLSDEDELSLSFAPDLGWRPLRHLLGVHAFGINAYTCHAAGGALIEEHDELGDSAGGHEEVYAVLTGHAVFTVAGEEIDGPDEFYVVLLDNGRSRILGTKYEPVLKCVRCGACLDHCPVYGAIGGHAYDSVYSGPIGAVLTPLLRGFDEHAELPYASSLCGACVASAAGRCR